MARHNRKPALTRKGLERLLAADRVATEFERPLLLQIQRELARDEVLAVTPPWSDLLGLAVEEKPRLAEVIEDPEKVLGRSYPLLVGEAATLLRKGGVPIDRAGSAVRRFGVGASVRLGAGEYRILFARHVLLIAVLRLFGWTPTDFGEFARHYRGEWTDFEEVLGPAWQELEQTAAHLRAGDAREEARTLPRILRVAANAATDTAGVSDALASAWALAHSGESLLGRTLQLVGARDVTEGALLRRGYGYLLTQLSEARNSLVHGHVDESLISTRLATRVLRAVLAERWSAHDPIEPSVWSLVNDPWPDPDVMETSNLGRLFSLDNAPSSRTLSEQRPLGALAALLVALTYTMAAVEQRLNHPATPPDPTPRSMPWTDRDTEESVAQMRAWRSEVSATLESIVR